MDMHVHSNLSDGQLSVPQVIDFYGARGFACIAITDHVCETGTVLGIAAQILNRTLVRENFFKYLELLEEEKARAFELYGMRVITGIEISKNSLSHSRSAHILGLGVTEWVDPNLSVVEICKAIHSQGGTTVAAHPVATGKLEIQTLHLWDQREDLHSEGHIDLWEVASGREIFKPVADTKLPKLATSDFHLPRHIHAYKTVLNVDRRPEDCPEEYFLEVIKKAGGDCRFWAH